MIASPVIRGKFKEDWYDFVSSYGTVVLATSDREFAEELKSQGITCLVHQKLPDKVSDITLSRNTLRCYFLTETTDDYILWIDTTYTPSSDDIEKILQREEDVVFKRQIPYLLVPDMAFALTKRVVMENVAFRYEVGGSSCECFNLFYDSIKRGFKVGWI